MTTKSLEDEKDILLKSLFDNNPISKIIINLEDGMIVDINTAFLAELGYTREEAAGKTISELDIFIEGEQQLLDHGLKQNSIVKEVELPVKCKDGSIKYGQFSGEIISYQGRKSFVGAMIHTDISSRKQAEEALMESEKRFMLALNEIKAGLFDWDIKNDVVYYSPLWKSMLGYADHEIDNTFEGWRKLWHPEDKPTIENAMNDCLRGESEHIEVIHRLRHKNGEWRWILARGGILRDNFGKPYRWVGTNIDITEQREQSLELERFFSINLDLLCIADTDGFFLKTNQAWGEILGYSTKELDGRRFLDFVHPDDLGATLETMAESKKGNKALQFVSRFRSKDGTWRFIEWRSHPYGRLIYVAARDITERIEYEKRILDISIRDPLTGVYNRRYIMERAEELLAQYQRNGKTFSVAMCDLDHFKALNDKYGHLAGDFILKQFTEIVAQNLRSYDLLGRYGGEEFIVIFINTTKRKSKVIMERIQNIVRNKFFMVEDNAISFTFSAGISECREQAIEELSVNRLMDLADDRLYEAKKSGRDRVVI